MARTNRVRNFDNIVDVSFDGRSPIDNEYDTNTEQFQSLYPKEYYMGNNEKIQSTLFNLNYGSKKIIETITEKYNVNLESAGFDTILFFNEEVKDKVFFNYLEQNASSIEDKANPNLYYFADKMIEDEGISMNYDKLFEAKNKINTFYTGEFVKLCKFNDKTSFYIVRIFNDINNAVSIMYDKYTTYIVCKKDGIKDVINILYDSVKHYFKQGIFEYDLFSEADIQLDTTVNKNYIITEKTKQLYDDIRLFVEDKKFYEDNDFPYKRGTLLIGSPGNGKSTSLAYIKKEFKLPIIFVQNAATYSLKKSFENANMIYRITGLPCVLFIEEVDALFGSQGGRELLLGLLDGVKKNIGVYTILTTNNPQNFDHAILNRPSRIDTVLEIDLPNEDNIKQYFKYIFTTWNEEQILYLSKKCFKNKFSFAFLNDFYILYRKKDYDKAKIDEILALKIQHIKQDQQTLMKKTKNITDKKFGFNRYESEFENDE